MPALHLFYMVFPTKTQYEVYANSIEFKKSSIKNMILVFQNAKHKFMQRNSNVHLSVV